MTTMAGPRKTISIHDYPEHLNPFREEDNHNKIRFWTIGRKLSRSNSITFSGIKDLRNSWSLRSFMRKGKKGEQPSSRGNKHTNVNGENSPIVYRRALQYSSGGSGVRSTVGSPERADRYEYVYGGSVTPLPRSRFQERLRSSQDGNSPCVTPRMARSDITGSRLSIESANPFEEAPIPPVRASRRKKKRAPEPPSASNADDSVTENLELRITESNDTKKPDTSVDDVADELNLKVELKIVEDEEKCIVEHKVDHEAAELPIAVVEDDTKTTNADNTKEIKVVKTQDLEEPKETNLNSDTEDSTQISFSKIDISKYRRNSSVNEDDIRLRRGNLEDFHSLAPNKRSKSLSHTLDGSYVAYHINLNEIKNVDINSNEEPQRVVCKVYEEDSRKKSIDNSISSTEKEFLEIDKATRELEREISKLNSALIEDDLTFDNTRLSVSEIRQKFDKPDTSSPNPIPKPRRSHYAESNSPVNGNIPA
ncbi:uncharacterized protein LOC120627993 [Pararge aegeria]|nr:uncharacterized protein LOC120627993 [Pararge aegeria]